MNSYKFGEFIVTLIVKSRKFVCIEAGRKCCSIVPSCSTFAR